MNIDPEGLRHHVAQVNHQWRGGLLGICLWSQGAGVSIVGDTRQDTTLFGDRVLARTLSSLEGSGFPGLASFMLFTLDDGSVLVLVRHEDHLLELLHVDAQRTNVGLMLSVVIPAAGPRWRPPSCTESRLRTPRPPRPPGAGHARTPRTWGAAAG